MKKIDKWNIKTAAAVAKLLLGFLLIMAALTVVNPWLQIILAGAGCWKIWRGISLDLSADTKDDENGKDN